MDVKESSDFIEGQVLLIDKELNWTSFQVVKKIRNLLYRLLHLKKIKVGHAGTLDPLATGLLIVCTGKATKTIHEIQNQDKTYFATIELGKTTPSFDLETEPDQFFPVEHIRMEHIQRVLQAFIGETEQVPPLYSAKKLSGTRAYEFARKGELKEMKPNTVQIHELEIIRFELPELYIKIRCSKGTYIRSLAHDIGKSLGCGAFLKGLRRTEIGEHSIGNAIKISELENKLRVM